MLPLPPAHKQSKPSALNQIILSKETMSYSHPHHQQQIPVPEPNVRKSHKPILLRPRRTNPIIWCGAFLCIIFSIILIVTVIAILIIFIAVKPKHPLFDATAVSLNSIYLDSPEYFNGDFTFLANFSNPNRKIDIRFEYLDIELYFHDRLLATRSLKPFTQRKGEARLEAIHMISSEVYLPLNLSTELRNQVQTNRVQYNIRGTFRVRASLGLTHFSYWLHGRCLLEMTGPPTGVLIARSCRTKR
ncbi:hypothetical protein MKW92_031758 [Papaver armeniacum]|nr:hypothetical protein MKW92_031758 [Papaver armeniacum]